MASALQSGSIRVSSNEGVASVEQAARTGEKKADFIQGLDSIRFVCAAWVAINHDPFFQLPASWATGLGRLGWFLHAAVGVLVNGPAAVIVFFVISGLCIHFPYRNGKSPKLTEYYTRRFVRIGLPAIAATFLSLWLGRAIYYAGWNDAVLWSVICEVVYYTLYPLLLRLHRRFGWRKLIVTSFVASIGLILTNPLAMNYPSFGSNLTWLLGLPCWLLGCLLAEEYDSNTVKVSLEKIWGWRFLVWGASTLCLILRFHGHIGYPWSLNAFGILVYFWLGLEIARFKERSPARWLESGGKWSYSLYLMHSAGLGVLAYLGLDYAEHFFLTRYLTTIGICYLFYLAVEKPSHRLAKRLASLFST